VIGALLASLLAAVLLFAFGGLAPVQVARAVGKQPSIFTDFCWLIWDVATGFGAGFVARMPRFSE
jgi:hypothetical protein